MEGAPQVATLAQESLRSESMAQRRRQKRCRTKQKRCRTRPDQTRSDSDQTSASCNVPSSSTNEPQAKIKGQALATFLGGPYGKEFLSFGKGDHVALLRVDPDGTRWAYGTCPPEVGWSHQNHKKQFGGSFAQFRVPRAALNARLRRPRGARQIDKRANNKETHQMSYVRFAHSSTILQKSQSRVQQCN